MIDPLDPSTFPYKTAKLSTGRTYKYIDVAGPSPSAPTLLCLHGFPDSSYGYRHQLPEWSRAARVLVPDMLGYGGTDAPADPTEYTTKRLCADLVALLDAAGVAGRVIVVGHDWGAYCAARFALWHPARLQALVLLSVPYTPPLPRYFPLEEVVQRTPNYAYQAYFADPASGREISANLPRFVEALYGRWRPSVNPMLGGNMRALVRGEVSGEPVEKPYVTVAELAHTRAALGDMHGPLSYYRTTKARFEEEHAAGLRARIDVPVLYMYGTADRTATPERLPHMQRIVPDIEVVTFEGVGHWVLLQARAEVSKGVLDWLAKRGLLDAGAGAKL